LRFSVNVFLPGCDDICCCRLPGRHHGVGIIEYRIRGVKPLRCGPLGQGDQPAVAGCEIDRKSGGMISARLIVRVKGAVGIDEGLQAVEVRIPGKAGVGSASFRSK
jgi:hypothetical protein